MQSCRRLLKQREQKRLNSDKVFSRYIVSGAFDWSRKIIEAHAAAEAEGKGVLVFEGKLIENLHVENAKRLVAMADAIAQRRDAAA